MNYEGITPESLKKKTTERLLNLKRAMFKWMPVNFWDDEYSQRREKWEYCHKIVVEELNTRPHVPRKKGKK